MIEKVASYLPEERVTNKALAERFPDWPSEKILEKTGIRERRIARPDECASDLAVRAAEAVMREGDRERIDFLIFCTQSPDYLLPTTACLLQSRLGLPDRCGAFDFNLGCSGYVYGLAIAESLLKAGHARRLLLLNADTYSKFLGPEDKGTRTIFGDAAAATILSNESPNRLHSFVFGTDGSGAGQLILPGSGTRGMGAADPQRPVLFMNGPEVFNFTIKAVPRMVEQVLQKAQLRITDIDYVIFHQANAFMLEHLRRRLGVPKEKFALCLEECGNTVSATIPIALESALAAGSVRKGMKLLLGGFGVGLSWAGCILEWNADV